jgi:hypothetical protein
MTCKSHGNYAEFPLLVVAAFFVRNAAVLTCLAVLVLLALASS